MPVRKCRSCGGGFDLKPRFLVLFGWPKARPIPPDLWAQMEALWAQFVESDYGRRPLATLAKAESEVKRRQQQAGPDAAPKANANLEYPNACPCMTKPGMRRSTRRRIS